MLGGLGVVLLLALVPLGIASRALTADDVSNAVIAVGYGGTGVVIARRQPRNAVGWVLLGCALLLAADNDGSLYAVVIYRLGHGTLPFGRVAILADQLWAPAIVLLPLAILVFPDGTVPGRWRWVPRAYLVVDIDRIISRALAYALVTGLLIGLYVGLVLLAARVLTFHSSVAVAAATLAAAALFNPLRRRVQHMVDRQFNRTRYDADKIIAAFAARLQDAIDPDTVQAALLGAADQALEPEHASLWIRQHGLAL